MSHHKTEQTLTGRVAKLDFMIIPLRASPLMSSAAPPADGDPDAGMPRHDTLAPGTRLEGGFEIERVIGASGFGVVYLASEARSERRVAIKEYLPLNLATRADNGLQLVLRGAEHTEAFERGRAAFVDESLLLARLAHPSLVKVLRSWQANGTAYRAMPHYAGHSLAQLRQAMDDPPDEPTLRALLEGVLGALEVLHAEGIVHGDIVPANILLLPDDHPVLLDSGAARRAIVGDRTRALMSLLEPSFAAPEQVGATQEPIGPWTDLYALAAVVHYCVSGRMPSVSTTPVPLEPLAQVVRRQRERLPSLHFSRQFTTAIDAALAPDAKQRPRSVAELRQAIDAVPAADEPAVPEASNDSTIGPPTSPIDLDAAFEPAIAPDDVRLGPPPTWYGARRDARPWAQWALPIGGVLLVLGIGGWTFFQSLGGAPNLTARLLPPAATQPGTQAEPVLRELPTAPTAAVVPRAEAPRVAAPTVEAAPATAPIAATPDARPAAATPPVTTPPVAALSVEAPRAEAPRAEAPIAAAPRVAAPAVRSAPARVAPTAAPPAAAKRVAARTPASPREACGARTQFSLYRCMQTECAKPGFVQHAQCKRLRTRDEVD